jgi:septation ring formation regulator EzrA
MKIRNNISLITVFTVIFVTQGFGKTSGAVANGEGSGGQNPKTIIKNNLTKSEQNIAKCKAYLKEIDKINQESKSILDNMDKQVHLTRLDLIRKDITSIEAELKSEKNPAQRAELQKMRKAIKEVDIELRRNGR